MQHTHTHSRTPSQDGQTNKSKVQQPRYCKKRLPRGGLEKGAKRMGGKREESVKQTLAQFISNLQTARTKANKKQQQQQQEKLVNEGQD